MVIISSVLLGSPTDVFQRILNKKYITHTGILLNRSEVRVSESGFKSMEFYLDCKTFDQNTGQEYPNKLKFQLLADKIALIDSFQKGERVTVHFNIKGREYIKQDETKGHIQSLNVWKIERSQAIQNSTSNSVLDDDDLPF